MLAERGIALPPTGLPETLVAGIALSTLVAGQGSIPDWQPFLMQHPEGNCPTRNYAIWSSRITSWLTTVVEAGPS